MDRKNKYFIPYTSKYSGGFDLLDTMKIPRPCAYKSYNMTAVNYYRGQNTFEQKLTHNNSYSFVTTLFDENVKTIF